MVWIILILFFFGIIVIKTITTANKQQRLKEKKIVKPVIEQPKTQTITPKSIYDFFPLNFDKIPDSSFSECDTEINLSGSTVKTYRKRLSSKILNIFDTLEIKEIDDLAKNYIFTANSSNVNILYIKELINNIYALYGEDSQGEGKFSNNDFESIKSGFWDRRWTENLNGKEPIALNCMDGLIEFTIWGLQNNKIQSDEKDPVNYKITYPKPGECEDKEFYEWVEVMPLGILEPFYQQNKSKVKMPKHYWDAIRGKILEGESWTAEEYMTLLEFKKNNSIKDSDTISPKKEYSTDVSNTEAKPKRN